LFFPLLASKSKAMAAITCYVLDSLTNRPALGMRVHLLCLTHKTALNEREFRVNILNTGSTGEWEFQGNGPAKITLKAFISDVCKNEESKWHLVCSAGKYYGRDKTSWPMVGLFFVLREAESRTAGLSLSHHKPNAYTHVKNIAQMEVFKISIPFCRSVDDYLGQSSGSCSQVS
jgi:hypothetical protein